MSILDQPFLGKNPIEVRISNSSIQTFKGCRRRWFLGDYLGLAAKQKTMIGALSLGSRIHLALEEFYKNGTIPAEAYNKIMHKENQLFLQSWEAKDPEKVTKFNNEADLGRIMLEGYYEWLLETNIDKQIIPEYTEKILAYKLNEFNPRVTLHGKVDMHVRRAEDNSIGILDHKSAASFNSYYATAHMSEQLMYYVMLEKLTNTDPNVVIDGGVFNLLKKVKRSKTASPPFYERMDIRFNDEALQSFWIRTLGTVKEMMEVRDALDAGQDHKYVAYPSPTPDCSWKCPFFNMCTMLDDGSNAEQYLEDNFEQVDPNLRYKENETE